MSVSRPHGPQPTRLLRPWDSPGKSAGVGAITFSNACTWHVKVKSLSRVRLFATPWAAAHQAPPSMGFSRQERWGGVPPPSPQETSASLSFSRLEKLRSRWVKPSAQGNTDAAWRSEEADPQGPAAAFVGTTRRSRPFLRWTPGLRDQQRKPSGWEARSHSPRRERERRRA